MTHHFLTIAGPQLRGLTVTVTFRRAKGNVNLWFKVHASVPITYGMQINSVTSSSTTQATPDTDSSKKAAKPGPAETLTPGTDTATISPAAQNAVKAAMQEAMETAQQTAQEAQHGDHQAQRLAAKEAAAHHR